MHRSGRGYHPIINSKSLANVHMHELSMTHMHVTTIILITNYDIHTFLNIYVTTSPF